MGRGSGVCKFLLIIFTFSLLVQGTWAAEANNETNTNSNDTIAEINGSINGKINGTIYNETNKTIIGIINGTVNGTVEGTVRNTQMFPSILLLPLFLGSLLFLFWLCRFFDRMNFCFVTFLLIASLLVLLWLHPVNLILKLVLYALIALILFFIYTASKYEYNKRKKYENNASDRINLIMELHDIFRNFIVIFVVLIWPTVLLYFDYQKIDYITFYGITKLQFPVYIIAASFIGVLSYLLLSIEETFEQLIPEYKKTSIAWSYFRRILIAPFIALVGFYLLNHLLRLGKAEEINNYFVFVFSFFAGVFTKTIEAWIFAWVQELLPGDKKNEFDARVGYKVENSCFVTKLRLDEDLAYLLYNAKIRKIEELASFNNNVDLLLKKVNIDTRNQGEGTNCPLNERKNTLGSCMRKQLESFSNNMSVLVNKVNTDTRNQDEGTNYPLNERKNTLESYMREQLESFNNNMGILINRFNIDTRNQGEGTNCLLNEMKKTLGSYTEEQLQLYIDRAKYYTEMDKNSDLVKYLKMDKDLAFKLWLLADITDIYDLKNCDPKYIHKKTCDYKKESQEDHDRLCECSEEIIQSFKEKAKVELEQDIIPVAVFLVYPISGKSPLKVEFTDKSTGSPTSWEWSFGDNTPHSRERNPVHTYYSAGTYTVSLTVKNKKGSSTNRNQQIKVE